MLRLQAAAGNEAVARWLGTARAVPTGTLQRKCSCGTGTPCQTCGNGGSHAAGSDSAVPAIVHEVLRSPGQRLDPAVRALMESRLGHDLGSVRVHTDPAAARSAGAVSATAYTVGSHVVFANGHYAPHTHSGRRLLAHELVHVIQQEGAGDSSIQRSPLSISDPFDPAEQEADRIADQVLAATAVSIEPQRIERRVSRTLQRSCTATSSPPAGDPLLTLEYKPKEADLLDPAPPGHGMAALISFGGRIPHGGPLELHGWATNDETSDLACKRADRIETYLTQRRGIRNVSVFGHPASDRRQVTIHSKSGAADTARGSGQPSLPSGSGMTPGNAVVAHLSLFQTALSGVPYFGYSLNQLIAPFTGAHAGGMLGERDLPFQLGQRGLRMIVSSSVGGVGHSLTGHGFDAIAWDPANGRLWLIDNKASGSTGPVNLDKATAITVNLGKSLQEAIRVVAGMPPFPDQHIVLQKLRAAQFLVPAGKGLTAAAAPQLEALGIRQVVTNAGGFATAPTQPRPGVTFVDLQGPVVRARQSDIEKATTGGVSTSRASSHAATHEKGERVGSTRGGASPAVNIPPSNRQRLGRAAPDLAKAWFSLIDSFASDVQERERRECLESKRGEIRELLQRNSGQGVTIEYDYHQIKAPWFSLSQPGPQFMACFVYDTARAGEWNKPKVMPEYNYRLIRQFERIPPRAAPPAEPAEPPPVQRPRRYPHFIYLESMKVFVEHGARVFGVEEPGFSVGLFNGFLLGGTWVRDEPGYVTRIGNEAFFVPEDVYKELYPVAQGVARQAVKKMLDSVERTLKEIERAYEILRRLAESQKKPSPDKGLLMAAWTQLYAARAELPKEVGLGNPILKARDLGVEALGLAKRATEGWK